MIHENGRVAFGGERLCCKPDWQIMTKENESKGTIWLEYGLGYMVNKKKFVCMVMGVMYTPKG